MKKILYTDYRTMETVKFFYDTTVKVDGEIITSEVCLNIDIVKPTAYRFISGDRGSADFNTVENLIAAAESLKGRSYIYGSIKDIHIIE